MRLRFASILTALTLAASSAWGGAPTWEELDTNVPTSAAAMAESVESQQASVDIYVRNGYVYLYTSRPVQVKVFSILGQLITQSNLPAGTHRMKLTTRGIYILRAGNITQRITI